MPKRGIGAALQKYNEQKALMEPLLEIEKEIKQREMWRKKKARQRAAMKPAQRRATQRRERAREKVKAKAMAAIEAATVRDFAKEKDISLAPQELQVLSKVLGSGYVLPGPNDRSMSTHYIRRLIKIARQKFAEHAPSYVEKHHAAVVGALATGDFDTAATHAEWAMENLSDGEDRLIEPKMAVAADGGPKVVVGIQMGGLDMPAVTTTTEPK